MKYIFQTLILLFLSIHVFGQKNITISGTVVENTVQKDPVEQVTIRLLSLPDSSLVIGTTSRKNGTFTLQPVSPGKYVLHISFIGYRNLYKPVSVDGKTTAFNMGTILLSSDDVLLQEAVVIGKAAEVVVKGDTVEYNAASYKTQENAVVEDLLKKLPGVEVDTEGKITVGGKEIKKILVDGKEFFSDDPKVASKNLPANMIEKLQVLDRKSDMAQLTGINDGEEETVINLTVKPNMKKGTVGNAAAGYGHDINSPNGESRYEVAGMVNKMSNSDRYTLMLNANNTNNMGASDMGGSRFGGMRGMRRGGNAGINESQSFGLNMNKELSPKLSLNGNVSYNGSDRNSDRNSERTTTYKAGKTSTTDGSTILRTISKNNDVSDNFGIDFRLEWKPDSSNTFIFRPNFSYNKSNSTQNQLFENFDGISLDTIYNGKSLSYNEGEGYNLGGSLEYAHQFAKPGRILSFTLRGSYNDSYSEETYDWFRRDYTNNLPAKDSLVNNKKENDYNSSSFRVQASYVEPLGKNYFLQFVYRINQSQTEDINSTYMVKRNEMINAPDTLTLNPTQSRSTSRRATEQRFGLNFKSIHTKYNYTIGLNVDPSNTINKTYQPSTSTITPIYRQAPYENRLPNVMGDLAVDTISQDVVNFSPDINFNYNFGKRTNLRIDYSGSTIQPTAKQLQDFTDTSDPNNYVSGNPDLKLGYENDFSARFEKFIPESQLFYNFRLNGSLTLNDITSNIVYDEKRIRHTTYENVNGNWNINVRGGMNTPLKNKKFTVGTFLMTSYQNRKSYSNGLLNTMKTFSLRDMATANYRSSLFDVGFNTSFTYSNSINEIQPDKNQQTYDYGLGGNTTWYLPSHFTIDSDIAWSAKRGYGDGFNQNETIWNAAVTKQVFNKKIGTGSVRLKIYDILQDRKSISRSIGEDYIQDTQSNTLQSFFMVSFLYRFSIFPKGSSVKEDDLRPERRWGEGRPR